MAGGVRELNNPADMRRVSVLTGDEYLPGASADGEPIAIRTGLLAGTGVRQSYQETILLADGQPDANPDAEINSGGYPDQVLEWRTVLSEIPVHHPKAKALIHAGDVVDRGQSSAAQLAAGTTPPYTFQDAIEDLGNLPFQEIDVIPGNHDRDYRSTFDRPDLDKFGYFKTYFPKQFYHKIKGNTVYIFMGDMGDETQGHITDYVFDWWVRLCTKFEHKNKIVVSHQSLPDTGLAGTAYAPDNDNLIAVGQRFVDKMTAVENPIKIDAWIRGHHGTLSASDPTNQASVSHGGCLFINVGLHIPSAFEASPSDLTYVIMAATDGERGVRFKRWNHKTKEFIASAEIVHQFTYPLVLESAPTFDGRYQASEFDLFENKIVSFGHIQAISEAEGYFLGPYWGSEHIIDDRVGLNIPANVEVGHHVSVPGGQDVEEDKHTHAYGFGAGWVGRRETGTDVNFSTSFIGYASGAEKGDDSRVETVRGFSDGTVGALKGFRANRKSDWLALTNGDFITFQHDLGTKDLEIVMLKVKDSSGNEFNARQGHMDGYGLEIHFVDEYTLEICAANDGIHRHDNNSLTAAQVAIISGDVKIALRVVPGDTYGEVIPAPEPEG